MQKVSSQSTNTGLAPSSVIAPTVATKVLAVVITSSFAFMLRHLRDNLIASVPELTPTAYLDPIKLAKFFSNSLSGLPKVKSPVLTKIFNFFHKLSQFENCCLK